jgi:hypothetical protein
MIGVLLAVLLGGAQAASPVGEAWNPTTVQLAPAVVIPPDSLEALLKDAPEPMLAVPMPATPAKADPGVSTTGFMPSQLEKAVVRPAL